MTATSPAPAHELTTDRVPVAALHTYHRNPRRGVTTAIAQSLRVNGQYRPIVVNKGTHTGRPSEVLAGNHTLVAARDLGWGEITVCWVDVDDDQAARIVTADNRTADLGDYDDRLLAELLTDLPDLDGTGYDPGDLDDLLAGLDATEEDLPPAGDPDSTPEPPAAPVAAFGDLWHLGPHRLLCGDSTDPNHIALVTNGAEPDIVYTDPPYGISIVKKTGKIGAGGKFRGKIGSRKIVPATEYLPVAGDDSTDVARDAFTLLTSLYPDAAHVWWGGNHYTASASLPDASCWLVTKTTAQTALPTPSLPGPTIRELSDSSNTCGTACSAPASAGSAYIPHKNPSPSPSGRSTSSTAQTNYTPSSTSSAAQGRPSSQPNRRNALRCSSKWNRPTST